MKYCSLAVAEAELAEAAVGSIFGVILSARSQRKRDHRLKEKNNGQVSLRDTYIHDSTPHGLKPVATIKDSLREQLGKCSYGPVIQDHDRFAPRTIWEMQLRAGIPGSWPVCFAKDMGNEAMGRDSRIMAGLLREGYG